MKSRRSDQAGSEFDRAVDAFWQWWASAGRSAAEAGIGGAGFDRFTGETAAGTPELRRTAERWYRHAPAADDVWEYHPARQPDLSSMNATMEFAGHELKLDELRFDLRIDSERSVIDTVVFHPSFARMPAEARAQVGFLALDWSLGEDGVSRWIGRFDTTGTRPGAGVPADGLIEAARALAERAGEPRWALLSGERDGMPVIATLAVSAKWVDHPLLDQHLAVRVPYADQTPAGLPGGTALDQLRELEDDLTARLRPVAGCP